MNSGPYSGIKVVDCTRVLAGPYCTMMMADQGATIIKVEVPEYGDDSRHIGPFIQGKSAYFMSVNRGKHSIALDLKAPEDRAVFDRLTRAGVPVDTLIDELEPEGVRAFAKSFDDLLAALETRRRELLAQRGAGH